MMPRRHFLESGLFAAAVATGGGGAAEAVAPAKTSPELYELRTIRLRIGPQSKIVNDYLSESLLPSLARLGAGPVGVFQTMVGPEMPTLHVLVPWPSAPAMAAAHAKLAEEAMHPQSPAAQ